MKTIVCEEPNRFVMMEKEQPSPKVGEALVRIRRIGICGTDLHAYRGNQPFFAYPRVLGHELSGEIVEIGDNVQGLTPGDRVSILPYLECGECIACRAGRTNCCTSLRVLGVHQDGGMQEFISIPADHLLPANDITLEQAAIVECLAIGAHAVRRAALEPGETVLVIGAGPIGLGVMKYAKLAGANVITLDINEERLAFSRQWAPADHIVNVKHEPVSAIAGITNGEFPTAVFDATGNLKSMESAIQYVSHGGRLIFVGLVKADISFSDPEFHKRELTMMSSRNAIRADFETVIASMKNGQVDTDAFITHKVGFDAMIGEFESWLKPDTGVIKAMVEL